MILTDDNIKTLFITFDAHRCFMHDEIVSLRTNPAKGKEYIMPLENWKEEQIDLLWNQAKEEEVEPLPEPPPPVELEIVEPEPPSDPDWDKDPEEAAPPPVVLTVEPLVEIATVTEPIIETVEAPLETDVKKIKENEAQGSLFDLDELTVQGEEWKGMPECIAKDLTPFKSIYVHFESYEDMQKFAEAVGQKLTPDTRSIWYPAAEIGRIANKRYVDDGSIPDNV